MEYAAGRAVVEAASAAAMPPVVEAASAAQAEARASFDQALMQIAPSPCGLTISEIDVLLGNNQPVFMPGGSGKRPLPGAAREGFLKKQRNLAVRAHEAQ